MNIVFSYCASHISGRRKIACGKVARISRHIFVFWQVSESYFSKFRFHQFYFKRRGGLYWSGGLDPGVRIKKHGWIWVKVYDMHRHLLKLNSKVSFPEGDALIWMEPKGWGGQGYGQCHRPGQIRRSIHSFNDINTFITFWYFALYYFDTLKVRK